MKPRLPRYTLTDVSEIIRAAPMTGVLRPQLHENHWRFGSLHKSSIVEHPLRALANEAFSEFNALRNKVKTMKDAKIAKHLRDDMHDAFSKHKRYMAAGEATFRENNKGMPPFHYDFHGLFVAEATVHANRVLDEAISSGDKEAVLVIGRGNHLAEYKPSPLRTAITAIVTQRKLKATFARAGPDCGLVRIDLESSRTSAHPSGKVPDKDISKQSKESKRPSGGRVPSD